MLKHLNFKRLPFLSLSLSLVLASCGASTPTSPIQGDPLPVGFTLAINAGDNRETSSVTLNDTAGHPLAPGSTLEAHTLSDDDLRKFGIDGRSGLVKFFRQIGAGDVVNACASDCDDWSFTDHPEHPPTKMQLTFQKAEILDFHAENTALASENFDNVSSIPALFTSNLAVSKTNSSTTSWSESNSFTFNQSIKYQIGFLGTGAGGSTGFSYNHSWGEGGSETTSTTIGTTSGVSVTLQPKQHVTATLSATQGTMRVRVTYTAALTDGSAVIWNIPRPFPTDGHLDQVFPKLEPALAANGRTTNVQVIQDLDIGYFSGGKIEIKDSLGNVLSSVPVNR